MLKAVLKNGFKISKEMSDIYKTFKIHGKHYFYFKEEFM